MEQVIEAVSNFRNLIKEYDLAKSYTFLCQLYPLQNSNTSIPNNSDVELALCQYKDVSINDPRKTLCGPFNGSIKDVIISCDNNTINFLPVYYIKFYVSMYVNGNLTLTKFKLFNSEISSISLTNLAIELDDVDSTYNNSNYNKGDILTFSFKFLVAMYDGNIVLNNAGTYDFGFTVLVYASEQ